MADLGRDLSGVTDLDGAGAEVFGRRALAEAIGRRLITPRGRLIDDANYGYDLRGELNRDVSPADLTQIKTGVETECLKDERVISAQASLQFVGNVLLLTVGLVDGSGPFTLVLSVNAVTASILSVL